LLVSVPAAHAGDPGERGKTEQAHEQRLVSHHQTGFHLELSTDSRPFLSHGLGSLQLQLPSLRTEPKSVGPRPVRDTEFAPIPALEVLSFFTQLVGDVAMTYARDQQLKGIGVR